MTTLLKVPKTVKGRQTLQNIISSSQYVFGEKGYHNTTINDIMDHANLALGTFYIYFNDKLSAYEYIVLDLQWDIRKNISIATQNCNSIYEQTHISFETYLNYLKENRFAFNLIWESQFVNYNIFRNFIENLATSFTKKLTDIQSKGNDINPEIIAYTMMGMASFLSLKYTVFDNYSKIDCIINESMKLLKNGLFNINEN